MAVFFQGAGARMLLAAIALWGLFLSASPAMAQGRIIWPYFDFPPFHYLEDGELKGVEPELVESLSQRLTQYEHTRLPSSPGRSLRMAREGENICFAGVLKNPAREEFLYFSLPMRLVPPMVAVVRTEDSARLGSRYGLSRELERGARLCLISGANIGKLQAIIDDHRRTHGEDAIHFVHTLDSVEKQLKLLLASRVDALLLTMPQLTYEARRMGIDSADITVLPIEEPQQYIVGHVACAKTAWGKRVIENIDAALADIVPTDEYRSLFLPWIDRGLHDEFNRQYERLLADPARRFRPSLHEDRQE